MTTPKDILRSEIYEVINKYNPNLLSDSEEAKWEIEDLLQTIETIDSEEKNGFEVIVEDATKLVDSLQNNF